MRTINGFPEYIEPSEKEIREAKQREFNVLEGLKKESSDLFKKADQIISFGNYEILIIGEEKYLYCHKNEVAGLIDERFMSIFNPETIKNNFCHNGLWDFYKEV